MLVKVRAERFFKFATLRSFRLNFLIFLARHNAVFELRLEKHHGLVYRPVLVARITEGVGPTSGEKQGLDATKKCSKYPLISLKNTQLFLT